MFRRDSRKGRGEMDKENVKEVLRGMRSRLSVPRVEEFALKDRDEMEVVNPGMFVPRR